MEAFLPKRAAKIGTIFYSANVFALFFDFFIIFVLFTHTNKMKNQYLDIFLTFSKIGAFTLGGGYAMIPLIGKEVVERKKWISEDEFTDLIALAQSAPGLLAVNASIFLGNKLKGIKGAIVATLGSTMPSFVMILVIAMLFRNYQDNPVVISVFKGIRPAVVALIAVPMINMARKSNRNVLTWIVTAAALILVGFVKISPIYVIIAAIIAGCTWGFVKARRKNAKEDRRR